MTKTCGDCRFYAKETEHCKLKDIGWKFATDTPCSGFTPREPITNGDKIIAGGMRAIAELAKKRCQHCIYKNCDLEAVCLEVDCADGIEAWLNAPAESEGGDE